MRHRSRRGARLSSRINLETLEARTLLSAQPVSLGELMVETSYAALQLRPAQTHPAPRRARNRDHPPPAGRPPPPPPPPPPPFGDGGGGGLCSAGGAPPPPPVADGVGAEPARAALGPAPAVTAVYVSGTTW